MKKINIGSIKEFIKKPKVYTVIFLILIILTVSESLLIPGITKGADIDYHLSRIEGIAQCLKVRDIKALLHPRLNGYANGLFYPQVFLYIPAILVVLGMKTIPAYKVFLFITNIATTLVMYFCIKSITSNRRTAIIGAGLYASCAYRMANLFWIAALGALQAQIFVPIVILGLYEIFYRDCKKWYILSIGILGLLYSHIISFVIVIIFMCLPVVLINILKLFKDKQRLKYFIYSIIIVLLMAAFFILPFLEQYFTSELFLNTYTLGIDLKSNSSIIKFPWNIIGIYASNWDKNIKKYVISELGIGLCLFILSIIYICMHKRLKQEVYNKYLIFLSSISIIYTISVSMKFIWRHLTIFNSIQFTWRLYLIGSAVFCIVSSILLEYIIKNIKKNNSFFIYMGITLLIVFNILYSRKIACIPENIIDKVRRKSIWSWI